VELAEVGDARVGGEIGAAVDHLLQRAAGGLVAAELDKRVDEDAVRLGDVRGGPARGQSVAQARAEVVARGLERGALGQCAGVARGEMERATQDRVSAHVVRGVAGLADLLRVCVREQDVAVGAARVGAHGRLEDPDALVGRRARGRRIGRRAQRRGVCGRAGDAVTAARAHEEHEYRERRGERDGGGEKRLAGERSGHGRLVSVSESVSVSTFVGGQSVGKGDQIV